MSCCRWFLVVLAATLAPAGAMAAATRKPCRNHAELVAALQCWRSAAQQQANSRQRAAQLMALSAAPAAAAKAQAGLAAPASQDAADSITNGQTAGVDEGGIVKRAGQHLAFLRRGWTLRRASRRCRRCGPIPSTEETARGQVQLGPCLSASEVKASA